jgi:hypothetical protein
MGTTKQSEGFGSAATEGNSDDKVCVGLIHMCTTDRGGLIHMYRVWV